MNESVLELLHGIFSTFLFIMSVTFSVVLLDNVIVRSTSAVAVWDSRNIYMKETCVYDEFIINGSSVIDSVCMLNEVRLMVDGEAVKPEIINGICEDRPEYIRAFYEVVDAYKEYGVQYEYDSSGSCKRMILRTLE